MNYIYIFLQNRIINKSEKKSMNIKRTICLEHGTQVKKKIDKATMLVCQYSDQTKIIYKGI